jgi:uncharacterized membrane protein YcjF (UPF0283 family)
VARQVRGEERSSRRRHRDHHEEDSDVHAPGEVQQDSHERRASYAQPDEKQRQPRHGRSVGAAHGQRDALHVMCASPPSLDPIVVVELRVGWLALGGGSFDMVAMFEIVFLIVCVVLGLWRFSRTSRFRARNSRVDHRDERPTTGGFSPDLPSHKFPPPGS